MLIPLAALFFMAQGMYRAFNPTNRKPPEVRHGTSTVLRRP